MVIAACSSRPRIIKQPLAYKIVRNAFFWWAAVIAWRIIADREAQECELEHVGARGARETEHIMAYLEDHQLYYKKTCPYCLKVLDFMDENKITLDLRNTLEPGNQEDLVRIGGKKQVPCLVRSGRALYESDDIIAYLREKTA